MQTDFNAVVTGGTRGIGYAIAEALVKDGYNVIVTGTMVAGCGPIGTEYHPVDFREESSISNFYDFLHDRHINILVNNAGINKVGKFADLQLEDFDEIIRVNLRAPFLLCQAVLPNMIAKKWGRIVNMTSIFGHVSKAHRALYSSSKFGLSGLTKALAAEVAEHGVLVNAVGPGVIDTSLTRSVLGQSGIDGIRGAIPMGRLGNTSEIASFVSWLVSDKNSYVTGQQLMVDGGYTSV